MGVVISNGDFPSSKGVEGTEKRRDSDGDDDEAANFLGVVVAVCTTDADGARSGESFLLCMKALAAGADESKARIILLTRIVDCFSKEECCCYAEEVCSVFRRCQWRTGARGQMRKKSEHAH